LGDGGWVDGVLTPQFLVFSVQWNKRVFGRVFFFDLFLQPGNLLVLGFDQSI
jgi:hypothetical protein